MEKLSMELEFTDTYKRNMNEHPAIREAMCLKVQFPAILQDIREGDLLAGRITWGAVGFSPEPGGLGYYCNRHALKQELAKPDLSEEYKQRVKEMADFWSTETTAYKVRAAYPEDMARIIPSDNWSEESGVAFPLYRMAGAYLDLDKLLNIGLPGLMKTVKDRRKRAEAEEGDVKLFEGMTIALEVLADCCRYYARQAETMAASASEDWKAELLKLAGILNKITAARPETMQEAMLLAWIYILAAGVRNYGRMDVYLGDFLASDLQKGVLTMQDAQVLVTSFWTLIDGRKTIFNGRVIIGGMGRRNEKNADAFALLALEASRQVKEVEPQLSLRFYKGMDPAILEKALDIIGEGRTYPLLYNDDVNVDAVARAFNLSPAEAEQYVPLGCGEYVIDHKSYGTPNGVINLLKALEITLRNGKDPMTGRQMGLKTGDIKEFTSFELLLDAYKKQVEHFVRCLADQEELEYKVVGEHSPFLYLSMLYDDCMEKGKPIFAGGIKYLGGTIETYGNINTSDSLTAINELVYKRGTMTLGELVTALDANFDGYEMERRLMLDCPKYGNDNEIADRMAAEVHNSVCNTVRDQRLRTGLHSYLVVIINNHANTLMGHWTGASADGRKASGSMTNANNPAGVSDRNGVTAFLNSLVKLDPAIHAGAVQNMKFSRDLFTNHRPEVKALLDTYFNHGGTQAMITVLNRKDLEKAMEEPEKYQHIFVRVGGFSARFVDLLKDVQKEVLSRTMY